MSRQPQLFAYVKDLATGRIRKVLIKPSTDTSKVERRMVHDIESGLWLYKHKYEYQDKKQLDNR